MRGIVAAGIAGLLAGCGDNLVRITAQVDPTATILVLDGPDLPWRALEPGRYVIELEPPGPYGIAQLVGPVATVVLAGLDDPRDWVLWNSPAPGTPLHTVDLRLTDTAGAAGVSIGNVSTVVTPPGSTTVMLPEGTVDLIAFRGDRALVDHDLPIGAATTLDLDLAGAGHTLVPRGLSPDSPFTASPQLIVRTRAGTTNTADFLGALPAAALADGDRQWLRFDDGEVGLEVDLARAGDAPLVLPVPTPVDATVAWEDQRLTVRWAAEQTWTTRLLYASAGQPPDDRVAWNVTAHPGWASEPGRFALPVGSGVDGWDPAYAIAPGTELSWWTLQVARPVDVVVTEHATAAWVNTARR